MLTLLLAKVVGLYFIVAGCAFLARHKDIIAAEKHFKDESLLRFSLALMIVIAGLFYTIGYYDFTSVVAGTLTLFGWLLLFKGLLLLFLSDNLLNEMVKYVNNKSWYMTAGGITLLIGLYLAGFGFGIQW